MLFSIVKVQIVCDKIGFWLTVKIGSYNIANDDIFIPFGPRLLPTKLKSQKQTV